MSPKAYQWQVGKTETLEGRFPFILPLGRESKPTFCGKIPKKMPCLLQGTKPWAEVIVARVFDFHFWYPLKLVMLFLPHTISSKEYVKINFDLVLPISELFNVLIKHCLSGLYSKLTEACVFTTYRSLHWGAFLKTLRWLTKHKNKPFKNASKCIEQMCISKVATGL